MVFVLCTYIYKDGDAAFEVAKDKVTVVILQILPRLLDEVHLGTGHGWSGDKAAVFGAYQAQIALRRIGTIFRSLEFSLESADPGDALLGHAFLLLQLPLVDADLLAGFVERFLQ